MTNQASCGHGRVTGGYCPHCVRDRKRGAAWADEKLANDPGFKKEAEAIAREMVLKEREGLCRVAVLAAMRKRRDLEPRLAQSKGVYWVEMAPLTPGERSIVLAQLRSMWHIRAKGLN